MDIQYKIDIPTVKSIFLKNDIGKYGRYLKENGGEFIFWHDRLSEVVRTWDYKKSLSAIRRLFLESKKYKDGLLALQEYESHLKEWPKELGEISWKFRSFDRFVEMQVRRGGKWSDQRLVYHKAADNYSFMKHLIHLRNQYIETRVFEENQDLLPVFKHIKKIDFYYKGKPYDLKNSLGMPLSFRKKHGKNWRKFVNLFPKDTIKSLYEEQGNNRFGCEDRVYIVFLNENPDLKNLDYRFNSERIVTNFTYEGDKYTTAAILKVF
jgi:hypothetical protein